MTLSEEILSDVERGVGRLSQGSLARIKGTQWEKMKAGFSGSYMLGCFPERHSRRFFLDFLSYCKSAFGVEGQLRAFSPRESIDQ